MTPAHHNQVVLALDTLRWDFTGGNPAYEISHAGTYIRSHQVDPAPCYAHDPELVGRELAHLQEVAPLPWALAICLLQHEVTGRTNGFYCHEAAFQDADYVKSKDGGAPVVGIIVLSGKRIPIHPAMTRYLVAHEYGHSVEERLVKLLGYKNDTELLAAYRCEVRPEATTAYGCGRWHQNIGELFANDFRVLVPKREVEFWPHAGFDHPIVHEPAIAWWERAAALLRTSVVADRSAA